MPAQATRPQWRAAAHALAGVGPVTAALHDRHGAPAPAPGAPPTRRFESLASAITHQQLTGRVAATIWDRVRTEVGDPFRPAAVLATGPERLRAAGLSNAKVGAILDLAERAADGSVRFDRIARLSDEEVISHLTLVRGIGPWTAQMFLMFDLRRLDVWPTGDYGVRVGFARAFDMDTLPGEKELATLGDPYRPYRSVLAWWCWREADTAASAVTPN